MAKRKGEAALSKIQRWYAYIGFLVLSIFLVKWTIDNRGEIFGYDLFRLPSKSMVNTLLLGDFIISDTWKYRNSAPRRGDVVIFLSTKDLSTLYVKRVIGLPNDVVRISKGNVYVNGELLNEPYVQEKNNRGLTPGKTASKYIVPENSYFLLGDNRDNSFDSRFLGHIPRNYIYGSVEFIWFSHDPSGSIRSERVGRIVN
jgi:signal peptidase I